MKNFKEHLNPKPVQESQKQQFVSIEEEVRSSLGKKIGKAAIAAVIGGTILGTSPWAGGMKSSKKANTEPEPRLVNPMTKQSDEQETQKDEQEKQKAAPNQQEVYHTNFHNNLQNKFSKVYDGKTEYEIILNAAKRNGIEPHHHEDLAMLYSIRKAENGGHGKQFGVLAPNARAKPGESFGQSLDRQAGHAAFAVVKSKQRYQEHLANGGKLSYVQHFGQRWAPPNVANDPTNLNAHWVGNVTTHRDSFLNPPTQ